MRQTRKAHARGISVIEILVALGVLVVIVSFASPSLSNVTAKADLRAAVENLEFSIRSARSAARTMETDVVMHIHSERRARQHSVNFTFPSWNEELDQPQSVQDLELPPSVRLMTDSSEVRFDSRGVVDAPVRLLLVSSLDEGVNERLVIE